MKKLSLLVLVCISHLSFSQTPNVPQQAFIEVTGTAKKEIEPNQIYISITLTEKSIDNKKYTIEAQEAKLNHILTELNIPKSKLTLADFSSSAITQKRKEIGIVQNKKFNLVLESGRQVSDLFDKLFSANIKEADVTRIDHTDILAYNKEVRIDAVKAAKTKAEYLLNAVGNKLGKPLEIVEEQDSNDFNYYRGNVYNEEFNANVSNTASPLSSSEFKKITVTFSYKVKYAIE
ncbi:SIMPL domain-containing protein [Flavobacterium amniphilum]|uniref:SIMPL domain-containing protein n=1 Tax=Flavobacterium amniphilum TaxID=1834035 RepID=UPI00202A8A3A|nr:SIMPL domain-containing protein [Flavobacterium amniphilum]MCL9806674.1 SIMPL domain-containing protein [Flavobacterium amniphilum]